MRKALLALIVMLGCAVGVQAQKSAAPKAANTTEKVYTAVEQMPTFPGGDAAMYSYIAENLKYPTVAQEQSIQGTVVVKFVVGKDGQVRDAKIIRGKSPELDAEALRVVKGMPRFTPGKQDGKPVSVYFALPIKFSLNK